MWRAFFLLCLVILGCSGEDDMFARRGGRFNRRGIGSANTAFTPLQVAGLVEWFHAESTTHTGDGTVVTATTDRSGQGNNGVEGAAGAGPIYRATRWGGKPAVEWTTGDWLSFSGSTLVAAATGDDKPITVVALMQPFTNSQMNVWGFGNSGNSVRCSGSTDGSRHYRTDCRGDGGTVKTVAGNDQLHHLCPQVVVWRRSANARVRGDGVDDSGGAKDTDVGVITPNRFVIGAQGMSGQTINARGLIRQLLVWNRELSDTELAQVERYLAVDGLLHKSGLGITDAPSIVFVVVGQSNAEGRGSTGYTLLSSGVYVFGHDLFYHAASEPISDPTNQVYQEGTHVAQTGWTCAMADYLRENGVTEDIIILQCAIGATSSTEWVNGLTTSPPSGGTLPGVCKLRLDDVARRANTELVFIINQGEQNAQDAVEAAAWDNDWDAFLTEMLTRYAGKFRGGAIKHIVQKQAATVPTPGASYPNWSDMRASIDNLVNVVRTDVVKVDFPTTPFDANNVHIETGVLTPSPTGLIKLGRDTGAAYLANIH